MGLPARDSVFTLSPHWERSGLLVAALLRPHPLLRDLAELPTVTYDRHEVRAVSGEMVAAVRRQDWYLPVREDHARRLALDLALQLRERMDGE